LDRWNYTDSKTFENLQVILNFIGASSSSPDAPFRNDRIARIIAVNAVISSSRSDDCLGQYISIQQENELFLLQISYRHIRDNASQPEIAHILPSVVPVYFEILSEIQEILNFEWEWKDMFQQVLPRVLLIISLYTFIPLYVLSRLLTVLFPFFIVVYLMYYDLLSNVTTLKLVMLFGYIGLQVMIFILGIFVFRIHWWLWHVMPGSYMVGYQCDPNPKSFEGRIRSAYISLQWPVVRILANAFGDDIGLLIFEYYVQAIKFAD